MPLFKGSGVALVTPFHPDKSVNYEELACLIEYQIAGQTDAIIVCGTTGEPVTMTEEERLSVISFVVKQVNKRVPVIAGTGGNSTEGTLSFSRKAEALGVDGLLIVTPYYNKATQKGLYHHYKTIAEAVETPILLYNVPSRTGVNLLPFTAAALGKDCSNIVGIKEAGGNMSQIAELASLGKGYLDIYAGNDDHILPVLSLGGVGVISVLANVAPLDTHTMVMEYLEGDRTVALDLQLKYLELIKCLFCEVNPIPVKKALEIIGFKTKDLRLPLTELEEEHKLRLREAMLKTGAR